LIDWVKDVVRRERIERAFVFSSPMASVRGSTCLACRSIVDFVDLDSAKWADYARRTTWPVQPCYEREARRLLAFEKLIAARLEGEFVRHA